VPLHAAGIYEGPGQECCSDYIVSSYTPTLGALLRAQQGQQTLTPKQTKLLAIAAEHAQDANLPRLLNVAEEVQGVLNAAATAGASGSSDASAASTVDVLAMFKRVNFVHLACHGVQHRSEPHKSHFSLSTGDLSVSELMALDLKEAFFAFLSACETAKGDQKHADEAIHLAATMLFVGFKSVVATMW
jgi:CHAT domain-containing protein